MNCCKGFLFIVIVAAAACATSASATAAHECGCYQNEVDKGIYAVMCAIKGTGTPGAPNSILGWGSARRKWGAASCGDCQNTFGAQDCTDVGPPGRRLRKNDVESESVAMDGVVEDAADTEDPDLYPCCLYASKEESYTDGIIASACKPGVTCSDEEFGSQYIGKWYVFSQLDNECFFVTFSDPFPPAPAPIV